MVMSSCLTSSVHPALYVLRVPQKTVHKMEEIVIILLQGDVLVILRCSLPLVSEDSQEREEKQDRSLKYFSHWETPDSLNVFTFILIE